MLVWTRTAYRGRGSFSGTRLRGGRAAGTPTHGRSVRCSCGCLSLSCAAAGAAAAAALRGAQDGQRPRPLRPLPQRRRHIAPACRLYAHRLRRLERFAARRTARADPEPGGSGLRQPSRAACEPVVAPAAHSPFPVASGQESAHRAGPPPPCPASSRAVLITAAPLAIRVGTRICC